MSALCSRRATALTLVLLAGSALSVGTAAGAVGTGAGAAEAPRAAVSLVSQPGSVPLGGDLPLGLRIDGDATGLAVRATVHGPISSRSGFERTVEGRDLGSSLATRDAPAAGLLATAAGRVLSLGLQAPEGPRDPARIPINRPGVYPIAIDLVDGDGNRLDGFVTHLVAVNPGPAGSPAIGEPLEVAWIWPVVAAPTFRPAGKPDASVVAELGPSGRLGAIADALGQSGGVSLTLAPGPETVESWASLTRTEPAIAAGIATLRAAAETNQVLTDPYVPIDAPSLEVAGLGSQTAPQYAQGADSLNTTLGTRVDPRTTVAEPVDPASLSRLRETGTDRVVVQPRALIPTESKFTRAAPFVLDSEGRTFTAAAADDGLARLLAGDAPVALRAQRFLSALAVIAYEQPNLRRGVVVLPQATWSPPADLLATVLAGLRTDPLVRSVTLDTLLGTVPLAGSSGDPEVRELAGGGGAPLAVTDRQFRSAQSRLEALTNLVGRNDPRVLRGQRALLVSLSSVWQGPAGRRRAAAELATIDRSLDGIVADVHVPESRTLTLTARRAEIPVSFQNDTGQAIRVRVSLQSDKLFFPDGAVQLLTLPPRNTTARFTVEARASGTFPLQLAVTSSDGRVTFQQSRITVRSTVVSNVGIFLTVGAGVFLAAWWLNHARRRRRGRGAGAAGRSPAAAPA